ncbi:MAG: hypothetical protein ACQETD_03960 [Pseudomonadota bacterium]
MAGGVVRRAVSRIIPLSISLLFIGVGINYLIEGDALALLDPDSGVTLDSHKGGARLVPLIFIIAGVAALIVTLRRRWSDSRSDTPWMEHPAWRDNRIPPEGAGAVWGVWIVMLLWFAGSYLAWPYTALMRQEALPLSLVPFLLPLVGVALLLYAIVHTRRWRRFADARVTLEPFPGRVGGTVGGQLSLALDKGERVTLSLRCVHIYWESSGSDSGRTKTIRTLWHDSLEASVEPGPRSGTVGFGFQPPANLPQSAEGSECYQWRLEVKAKVHGPDLDLRFMLPVFASKAVPKGESGTTLSS